MTAPVTDETCRCARVRVEDAFGERLRGWIASSGTSFAAVARLLGLPRTKLYAALDGAIHVRAAWLELLPPAVELAYLAERAEHHACELRPAGVATDLAAPRALHNVVLELTDVVRAASEAEADGHLSPDEIRRELAEWEDVDRVRAARVAMLRSLLTQHGGRAPGSVSR